MKNSITILMMIIMVGPIAFSQVGINTTNPDASAILDVYSTDKGFLPPRLDQTQINALNDLGANGGPATGLVVYNTSVDCLQVNIGTPTNADWVCLQSGGTDSGGGGGTTIVNGVCTLEQVAQDSGDPMTGGTEVVDLPMTPAGQIWMDRNLGASRKATSLNDTQAFGDYYQFGRGKDGHQDLTSSTTALPNIGRSVVPGHGDFIVANTDPQTTGTPALTVAGATHQSWVDIGTACDLALYQNGNDPCPDGYRIPTIQEWENEFPSTMTAAQKEDHWFNVLALPAAGIRRGTNSDGAFSPNETYMISSDINTTSSLSGGSGEYFDGHLSMGRISSGISVNPSRPHANGESIRCIKE